MPGRQALYHWAIRSFFHYKTGLAKLTRLGSNLQFLLSFLSSWYSRCALPCVAILSLLHTPACPSAFLLCYDKAQEAFPDVGPNVRLPSLQSYGSRDFLYKLLSFRYCYNCRKPTDRPPASAAWLKTLSLSQRESGEGSPVCMEDGLNWVWCLSVYCKALGTVHTRSENTAALCSTVLCRFLFVTMNQSEISFIVFHFETSKCNRSSYLLEWVEWNITM